MDMRLQKRVEGAARTRRYGRLVRTVALVALGLLSQGCAGRCKLERLTGVHTKAVWVQDVGEGRDVFARGSGLVLMGYDSRDGRGPRAILEDSANYLKPIITPDGDKIVFSNREGRFFIVNWDGTGRRKLGGGVALDVWRDPETGAEWVYAGTAWGKGKGTSFAQVSRFRLDDPDIEEVVWEGDHVDLNNFQKSRDGTRFATLFPWPHGGVGQFSDGTWDKYGRGCWVSMAPDNSYRMWIFDEGHKNLHIFGPDGASHVVNINSAPGIDDYEVYHPRWSNHVRYMAKTGPYKVGEGSNKIRGGGRDVEVYVGRFDPQLESVEAWVRVTHNERADFFPDVWVQGGDKAGVLKTAAPEPAELARVRKGCVVGISACDVSPSILF